MSEPDLQTLLSTIGKVNDTLLENPRCAKILRGIQDGEYPDLDAGVRHLMVALKEEGLLPELQIAAKEVGTGMISQEALEAAGRPLHMKTSTGINQLNPLVEAAIAERVGLDGDVPEARYGPFPKGSKPAVPVLTMAMDPVVVGIMLSDASETVGRLLEDAAEDHAHLCGRILEDTEKMADESGRDVKTALTLAEKQLPMAPTGVPGYQAGFIPEAWPAAPPDLLRIAALTTAQRQEHAHRALATTQGRRSLAPPIAMRMLSLLRGKGIFGVVVGIPVDEAAEAHWTVTSYGAKNLSSSFMFPEVAAAVLVRDLRERLGKERTDLVLEVTPYSNIPDRQFGWRGRLGRRKP